MEKITLLHFCGTRGTEFPFFMKQCHGTNLQHLKYMYLRFDDKPNGIRSGTAADRFAPIRDVLNTFTSMCQSKYTCNFSLTVERAGGGH